jgi:hypothetical protein
MNDNEHAIPPVNGNRKRIKNGGVSSGIYGLAFIGALVYYMQHAATFGAGIF